MNFWHFQQYNIYDLPRFPFVSISLANSFKMEMYYRKDVKANFVACNIMKVIVIISVHIASKKFHGWRGVAPSLKDKYSGEHIFYIMYQRFFRFQGVLNLWVTSKYDTHLFKFLSVFQNVSSSSSWLHITKRVKLWLQS